MNGFSAGEEDSQGPSDHTCCLIETGVRCTRPAGNAAYSNKIGKFVLQRRMPLKPDTTAKHFYICEDHKRHIHQARCKRRRKDSEDDSNETDTDIPEVDLYQLQVNTLRRYKRHFKVSTRPGLNKAQMVETLMEHFKSIQVKEKEVLTFFIYTVKTNNNKLDQKNGLSGENT
ncbi:histone deacetylase complex subunit SAP30 homolog [Atheta coriaria]|uniref:histone deacetylase complex subunit SAP30 homolog n=1 Tax=Dalotia coriaria TaxID=877792 RepID=UPI0031F4160F